MDRKSITNCWGPKSQELHLLKLLNSLYYIYFSEKHYHHHFMHKKTESQITLPEFRRARFKSGLSIAKTGPFRYLTLPLWAHLMQRASSPTMEDSRRN